MREKKLFKQVSDRQMPDLEAIRKACIEKKPDEKKSKIIRLSTPRLISVAAIFVLLCAGMVAAFANPGGVFIPAKSEVTVTETKVKKASVPEKSTSADKSKSSNNSIVYSTTSSKNSVAEEKTEEEKLIKLLVKNDINVSSLTYLGEVDGLKICYATNYEREDYSCDYIIGEYVFSSDTQCAPYGLGIYALNEEQCFTLGETYSQDIFEDFDEAVRLIENSEVGITVKRDDSDSQVVGEYFGIDAVSAANVGELDGGKLIYRTDADYTGETGTEYIGDYEFFYSDSQETYALGLYFLCDGTVYTLTDAVEQGKITDISKAVELVNELKTKTAVKIFITEKEEPTTEVQTEEPTDATVPE